jgi:hypothetical protein
MRADQSTLVIVRDNRSLIPTAGVRAATPRCRRGDLSED